MSLLGVQTGQVKARDFGCNSQKGSWVSRARHYVRLRTLVSGECIQRVSALDSDAYNAYHRYPVLDGYQTSISG